MPELGAAAPLPFADGPAPPLAGARVAIAGRLWSISRRDAAAALSALNPYAAPMIRLSEERPP